MWTTRIIFGLLALTMGAVSVASFVARRHSRQETQYLAQPLSELAAVQPGDALRVSGKLKGPNQQRAPIQQKPCVAVWTFVASRHEHKDNTTTEGRDEIRSHTITDSKLGPEALELEVGQWTVRVPLALWTKRRGGLQRDDVMELPSGFPPYEPDGHGTFLGYLVRETVLAAGASLFLAGRVARVDGQTIDVAVDPKLERVELTIGPQQQLVAMVGQQTKARGYLGLITGAIALLFVGLLVLFEYRSR